MSNVDPRNSPHRGSPKGDSLSEGADGAAQQPRHWLCPAT